MKIIQHQREELFALLDDSLSHLVLNGYGSVLKQRRSKVIGVVLVGETYTVCDNKLQLEFWGVLHHMINTICYRGSP